MHSPRSYGLFAPDELSSQDRQAVESLARSLTNFKDLSSLPSLKRSITLSDGRIATAIDMGGIFKVLVSDKDTLPERVFDGLAHSVVPMWFSAVVENAMPRTNQGVELKLTEWTRRRLVGYVPDAPLPSPKQQLLRFEIDYPKHLEFLKLENPGIFNDTQYLKMRPTWHSGAMAEVVQVVAGFGRQDFDTLPENEIERAMFRLPETLLQQVNAELKGFRLPVYSGFVPISGQFQYSYIARECHGVAFGADGMAWLLRLNSQGVYAMPLPLIPATTTKAFRDYVASVGDDELLHLIERFGGVPSGEAFPSGNDLLVWERAGAVVKICETDFFQYSPVYDAGGFSFNSRGDEAFNTCFEYDDSGMMWVYGYKMRLKIGACESHFGYLADNRDKWASLSSDEQVRLNDYLGGLLAILGLDTVGLAIRYKIRRASVSDLLNRAVVGVNFEQEKAYWDTLVMKPIVECSGGLNRVTRGAVYFKKRRNLYVPNVKFPELKAIGCASFPVDLREYWKAGNPDVRCDTVLFGWFVNDTLRVAKYFYDERAFASQTKSTFEEYMIIGEWEKTTTVGLAGLVGSVYCTDFDDRREVSPTVEYTHLKGWDLGYGKPFYATPILFQQVGSVSRNRFFGYEEKIERTIGAKLDVGVCVPVYCRDALLYAMHDKFEQKNYSERVYREAIADPYSYQMWTYDHVFHWMGRTIAGNKGKPHPRDSKPVYVDSEIYKPSPVSDYANNGSWMQTVSDITPIVQPYMWENGERRNIGITFGGEPPPLKMYHHETKKENGGKGYLSVVMKHADAKVVHKEMPNEWYFETSPDPLTLEYFYRDACFNTIGVLEYGNISETKKNSNKRFSWGKSRLFDDDKAKACFFIGVLNE